MTPDDLVDSASHLASTMLTLVDPNMSPHDLVMVLVLAERMFQEALFPEDWSAVMDAVQEADATYLAMVDCLEDN